MFNFTYFKKTVTTNGHETKKDSKTEIKSDSLLDEAFNKMGEAMNLAEEAVSKVCDEMENSGATIECDDISVVIKDNKIEIKGKDIKEITVNGKKIL